MRRKRKGGGQPDDTARPRARPPAHSPETPDNFYTRPPSSPPATAPTTIENHIATLLAQLGRAILRRPTNPADLTRAVTAASRAALALRPVPGVLTPETSRWLYELGEQILPTNPPAAAEPPDTPQPPA